MGNAQNKSRIRKEKLKFKPKKLQCKDDSRKEDATGESQNQDGIFGGQKEDSTYDTCNKNNESRLFYGTDENQVSEGGEADLHGHVASCKKNPGHSQFTPVNDFSINHLPIGFQDSDLVEFIKATADLTFRVDVNMTSKERPEFWPNTNKQYPFHDKTGNSFMRLGTGMVRYVNKWSMARIKRYSLVTCKCHKCHNSETPSEVRGEIWMYTATHVVFDDLEARHTSCRLFYDRQDSPLVTLHDWTFMEANIEEDWCELIYVTCDVDLLDRLINMVHHCSDSWDKVFDKYTPSIDKVNLSFIVSHPHGCPKQVTVGQWVDRCKVSDGKTKYTYTTCTCPGSSGARVHSLGYDNGLYYVLHVHSGVNAEGLNYSGTGRDLL